MLALRYVYVLALVVWLGGIVVLGAIVAPSLAGDAFGVIITRFHYVTYGAGLILLLSLVAMAVLGPRPPAFAVRCGLIFLMLAVALYSGFIVLGNEQLSTRLMMFDMVGALVLLYWEARER